MAVGPGRGRRRGRRTSVVRARRASGLSDRSDFPSRGASGSVAIGVAGSRIERRLLSLLIPPRHSVFVRQLPSSCKKGQRSSSSVYRKRLAVAVGSRCVPAMSRDLRRPISRTNDGNRSPLVPAAKPGGRPRTVDVREVLNAIAYLLRTGCAWRLLPHDFPPWPTVYDYSAAGGWTAPGRPSTPGCAKRPACKTAGPRGPRRRPGRPVGHDDGPRRRPRFDAGKRNQRPQAALAR